MLRTGQSIIALERPSPRPIPFMITTAETPIHLTMNTREGRTYEVQVLK